MFIVIKDKKISFVETVTEREIADSEIVVQIAFIENESDELFEAHCIKNYGGEIPEDKTLPIY